MIKLEKRPQPSALWSLATPVVAVLATRVFGGLLFVTRGGLIWLDLVDGYGL